MMKKRFQPVMYLNNARHTIRRTKRLIVLHTGKGRVSHAVKGRGSSVPLSWHCCVGSAGFSQFFGDVFCDGPNTS